MDTNANEPTASTSAGTIRSIHLPSHHYQQHQPPSANASPSADLILSMPTIPGPSSFHHSSYSSQHSSPRSSVALPSPPDSPSDSVSSLPSVSSSFFFSSAAASPPHPPHHTFHTRSRNASGDANGEGRHEHEGEEEELYGHEAGEDEEVQGLIIPSLTLPSPLPRPTAHGAVLGTLRLLVLGAKDVVSRSALSRVLLDENEDVVEVGRWEGGVDGSGRDKIRERMVSASTCWAEQHLRGIERFEPARNVEIVEIGYDQETGETERIIEYVQRAVHRPFGSLSDLLHPACDTSPLLADLVASPSTPLFTALIFLMPHPNAFESKIISSLSLSIPTIVMPRSSKHQQDWHSALTAFKPTSLIALRSGLFRSPETLANLRHEAAQMFLNWRHTDSAHQTVLQDVSQRRAQNNQASWDKAAWELEMDRTLSRKVGRTRLKREQTITQPVSIPNKSNNDHRPLPAYSPFEHGGALDPLHIPSLFVFSLSLLGPLKNRITRSIGGFWYALVGGGENGQKADGRVGASLVGGFCLGIGMSLLFNRIERLA